jgi:predicted outer membrane repeat protein
MRPPQCTCSSTGRPAAARLARTGALLVLLLSLLSGATGRADAASPAASRTFPGPFPCNTLQGCVNASSAGDTISLSAGSYAIPELQINKPLTLRGAGRETTVLEAAGAHRVIFIQLGEPGQVRLTDLTVRRGSSDTHGGGIYTGFGSQLALIRVQVEGNNAAQDGGGIFAGGALTATDLLLQLNSAGGSGGGLSARNTVSLAGGLMKQNSAGEAGGAVHSALAAASVTDATFGDNEAGEMGGALSLGEGGSVTNATFAANQVTGEGGMGGAIYALGALEIANSLLETNRAAGEFGSGGAVHAEDVQVRRSIFRLNQAGWEAGALRVTRALLVDRSRLYGNRSVYSGAVRIAPSAAGGTNATVTNSVFYGNWPTSSTPATADLYLDTATSVISNNTFGGVLGPQGATNGHRAIFGYKGSLALRNNIFSRYGAAVDGSGHTLAEEYNIFWEAPVAIAYAPGAHSLAADPRFVDPVGSNYALGAGSPGIDSGDNGAAPGPLDLAGQPRRQDVAAVADTGAGAPPVVDRGAYETASSASPTPTRTAGPTPTRTPTTTPQPAAKREAWLPVTLR